MAAVPVAAPVSPAEDPGQAGDEARSGVEASHADRINSKYTASAFERLQRLRLQGVLCDITLKAEDAVLQAHRVVLAACSDYFQTMFTSDFKESKQQQIKLHGVSGAGLKEMVAFAYSGSVKLNLSNVSDVLGAASHFQCDEAVNLCAQFLRCSITTNNCIDIFHLGELYSLHEVTEFATNFMLENFESLASSEHYFKLTNTELANLLKSNSLKVSSEYALFELVLHWIKHDKESRKQYALDLLKNVRFQLMTVAELIEKVSICELLDESNECLKLIMKAKDYHLLKRRQPLMQTISSQVRCDHPSLVRIEENRLSAYSLTSNKTTTLSDCTWRLYKPCTLEINNFLFVCGGKAGNYIPLASDVFLRYDPRFDEWLSLPQMLEPRRNACLVYKDGYIYAIGGYNGDGMTLDSMERFCIAESKWEMKAALPEARQYHAACTSPDQQFIFVSGGKGPANTTSNIVFAYNPANDYWFEVTTTPVALESHGMCVTKDKLLVFGGKKSQLPDVLYCYAISTEEWSSLTHLPTISGCIRGVFSYENNIYAIKTVESMDTETRGVEQISVMSITDSKQLMANKTVTLDLLNSASFCALKLPTSLFH